MKKHWQPPAVMYHRQYPRAKHPQLLKEAPFVFELAAPAQRQTKQANLSNLKKLDAISGVEVHLLVHLYSLEEKVTLYCNMK